jgi:hypothetical protein
MNALIIILALQVITGSAQHQGSAVLGQTHRVELSWTPAGGNATGQGLYRATKSGGPYWQFAEVGPAVATYTDGAVTSGQTYYYIATTITPNRESAPSNEAQAVIP